MQQPTRGWKTDEERGPTGAWFVRAIGERSMEQIAKDMAERGYRHEPDYYRGIMSGSKKPGRVLLRALTEYLGSSPEPSAGLISDQSDLIAALTVNTAAIGALVERIGATLSVRPAADRVVVIPAPTARVRRRHWLELARQRRRWTAARVDKELEREAGTYAKWRDGTTQPRGAEVQRLAERLDIPEWVITNPPPTDVERLGSWHFGDATLQQAM